MRDDAGDEAAILEAMRALEAADTPLRPRDWQALEDRHLRELVSRRLHRIGRQLITVSRTEGGPVDGYLSDWSDDVVPHLAGRQDYLQPGDLAVLAIIYLHTEVLGSILGEDLASISEQLDAHTGETGRDVVRGQRLADSLARLRAHQLINRRNQTGPALGRLSRRQRDRLEDNLVLLLRPDSIWARDIRIARESEERIENPL
ncbi:hypothetical protein HH310_19835 [Actinoplanes sp. TBRC 11911]|uniref:hypothetical protein n=1 Tax=Actinoplanes sp. TBRC 11911 TaxID=2729386 RepID=UPI00145D7792|nr:hypothetical protein [Actinoplanes sp. TBRC 11911]NMO53428.1 hypothetical protein [Actinoplanes sp. TBRC 11911]